MKTNLSNLFIDYGIVEKFERETQDFLINIRSNNFTEENVLNYENKFRKFNKKGRLSEVKAIFAKMFFSNKLAEYCNRKKYDYDKAYFILKLAKLGCAPSHIIVNDFEDSPSSDLLDLVYNEHIAERMRMYGHKFDPSATPKFRFTYSESIAHEQFESKEQYIDFFNSYKNFGIKLRVEGKYEDGRFKDILIDDLDNEKIMEILENVNGTYRFDTMRLIYPQEQLTIKELCDSGVIIQDPESGAKTLSNDYQYTDEGITFCPPNIWKTLRPVQKGEKRDHFRVEFVLTSRAKGTGVFYKQGHVHVKITTPSGEDYSVGLFPAGGNTGSTSANTIGRIQKENFRWQKGRIVCGDPFRFVSSRVYWSKRKIYTLDTPEKFHSLMDLISNLQGYHIDEEGYTRTGLVMFHTIDHNCTTFSRFIEKHIVKDLGAKIEYSDTPFSSPLSKLWYRIKKKVLAIFLSCNSLRNYAGFSNKVELKDEYSACNHSIHRTVKAEIPTDIFLSHFKENFGKDLEQSN